MLALVGSAGLARVFTRASNVDSIRCPEPMFVLFTARVNTYASCLVTSCLLSLLTLLIRADMSRKYKVRDQSKLYFVTCTVVQWVDVFTRRHYKDLVLDSLRYCIEHKGLELYAYCLMTSHLHMIVGTRETPIEYIMRDMKRHTSKYLYELIETDAEESRRNWMCWIFRRAGQQNPANNEHQFWQQGFHPIELTTSTLFAQKLDYIHYNPVISGFVDEPEHYLYSSARDYGGQKGLIEVIVLK